MATMLLAFLLFLGSAQDAGNRLVGEGWREWTLHRFEITMGASGSCKAGSMYRFSADHTVTIRECKDGHVVSSTDQWNVTTEGEADAFLVIGGKRYHLFFKERMAWSRCGSKSAPTSRWRSRITTSGLPRAAPANDGGA